MTMKRSTQSRGMVVEVEKIQPRNTSTHTRNGEDEIRRMIFTTSVSMASMRSQACRFMVVVAARGWRNCR
jgi:hypothetical protein